MDLSPIAHATVAAAASFVTALAAAVVSMLPRIWRYMEVRINGADTELVRHAINNAAEVAIQRVKSGTLMHVAIMEMVAYVTANLPTTVKRIGTSEETLETMCRAAYARLVAERK